MIEFIIFMVAVLIFINIMICLKMQKCLNTTMILALDNISKSNDMFGACMKRIESICEADHKIREKLCEKVHEYDRFAAVGVKAENYAYSMTEAKKVADQKKRNSEANRKAASERMKAYHARLRKEKGRKGRAARRQPQVPIQSALIRPGELIVQNGLEVER